MQSTMSLVAAQFARTAPLCLAVLATLVPAQRVAGQTHKPVPVKIEKQIMIFPEAVVTEQWPHTLNLVNAPQDLKLLNPGQCIRLGVVATGDDRDSFLEKTQLSFRVDFAGQVQDHAVATLAAIKEIKPEGGDFVTAVLNSANIENPLPSIASLGASADGWCVPDDAQDGTATINAEIDSPKGREKLKTAAIQIESFETGARHEFENDKEPNDLVMTYYRQPNPARLVVLLRRFAVDAKLQSTQGVPESTIAFIAAALKTNPTAAKDFMARVSSENGFARAVGLLALRRAGYDTANILEKLGPQERTKIENLPQLPDPSDLTGDANSATRLDMSWGEFGATGALAPLQNVTRRLAWRADYEDFEKLLKTPNHSTEWTPAIMRAVTYASAGWALGSFQRTDPLAADYIEYMIAAPDTPPDIKSELKGLSTNPAFKQGDQK